MKKISLIFFCSLFFAVNYPLWSQNTASDSTILNKKRFYPLVSTLAVGYTGSMVGLGTLWYSDYAHSPFHFFNDNNGWMQMDKVGHFATSYWIGRDITQAFRWAGVKEKKSVLFGGCVGLFFLTSVEFFDGISVGWGASPMDVVANLAGAALSISQDLKWKEHRISIKFSYSQSPYSKFNPNVLGNAYYEKWLKDYNGQTYWLSINPGSFLKESTKFPKWLNIAFGYGANGMLAAIKNPAFDKAGNSLPNFERYRQWYFSPDIDFTMIKTKNKFLNFLKGLSFIKIPMPAIEYNNVNNLKFHWLFF